MPFDIGYSFVNYRRSNQQVRERITNSLKDYLKASMSYAEIIDIIDNMESDYEDRVDDYII